MRASEPKHPFLDIHTTLCLLMSKLQQECLLCKIACHKVALKNVLDFKKEEGVKIYQLTADCQQEGVLTIELNLTSADTWMTLYEDLRED